MRRIVNYIVICFLVVSMVPVDVFALDESDSQVAVVSSEETAQDGVPISVNQDQPIGQVEQSDASEVVSQAVTPEDTSTPVLFISEVRLRGCLDGTSSCTTTDSKDGAFVELYNSSPDSVVVNNWTVRYVVANETGFGGITVLAKLLNLQLDGYSYAVVGKGGLVTRGAPLIVMTSGIGNSSQGYIQLLDDNGRVVDMVGWGVPATLAEGYPTRASDLNNSMQRCENEAGLIVDTNNNKADFLQYEFATPGTGIRCVTPAPIVEVNNCEGIIISEIAANTVAETQFIELYNTTAKDVALGGCQLQTNRSTVKSFIFSDELIGPGAYRVVYIQSTDLILTKTTTGTAYLLSSDGKNETDTRQYANLAIDTSWSWFGDDMWQQTYAVTPGRSNVEQPYLPCDEGYVRNLETGRCNKVVVATIAPCADNQYRSEETNRCRTVAVLTGLLPCKDGQYRSEETNRCRSIALAGSTLTPCKDNQYRSEETNRCRSIITASANLVPCKDNQYRSEETNRCRNVTATAIPDATFAVTPVKETGKAFIGWWALGGVGLLAVGYGAWEWRREVVRGMRKFGEFFSSHK
jgi:hypothetical protein